MLIGGLAAALGAAALFGVAAVLQALAARREPMQARLNPRLLLTMLRQPLFLVALALNLSGFGLHLIAVRSLPLFLAQAGIAGSLAVTAVLADQFFSHQLTRADWTAVLGVSVGLLLLAVSAGKPGHARAGGEWTLGLAIAVIATGVAGAVASRYTGSISTSLVGMVAGLGFALVSLNTRLLPALSPAQAWHEPTVYLLIASGCLAFLLYSVALQRGSVTAATAPMIATQTILPAAVGFVLLGDKVREGWIPGAILGLVLAVLGAVTLARYEAERPESLTFREGSRNRR